VNAVIVFLDPVDGPVRIFYGILHRQAHLDRDRVFRENLLACNGNEVSPHIHGHHGRHTGINPVCPRVQEPQEFSIPVSQAFLVFIDRHLHQAGLDIIKDRQHQDEQDDRKQENDEVVISFHTYLLHIDLLP